MGFVARKAQEVAQALEFLAGGHVFELGDHVLDIFGDFSRAGLQFSVRIGLSETAASDCIVEHGHKVPSVAIA
jgi:hypothetical protein